MRSRGERQPEGVEGLGARCKVDASEWPPFQYREIQKSEEITRLQGTNRGVLELEDVQPGEAMEEGRRSAVVRVQ